MIKSNNVLFNASGTKGVRYGVGGSYTDIDKSEMTFNWEFSEIYTNEATRYPITDGANPLSYFFDVMFAEVGRKVVNLRVDLK